MRHTALWPDGPDRTAGGQTEYVDC